LLIVEDKFPAEDDKFTIVEFSNSVDVFSESGVEFLRIIDSSE
jgi:hypothetical protein